MQFTVQSHGGGPCPCNCKPSDGREDFTPEKGKESRRKKNKRVSVIKLDERFFCLLLRRIFLFTLEFRSVEHLPI
jgi:hypothetical protein